MKSRRRRLLNTLLLLAALVGAIALILLRGPLAPVRVETAAAERGELQPTRFGVGTVEARRYWRVGPTRSGRLASLEVDHGDRVRAGQLLGRMDPVDLEARLAAAEESVSRARTSIRAAEARLAEIEARLTLARTDAERYEALGRQHQERQEVVDARRTEARAMEAQRAAARAEVEAARHDLARLLADREAVRAQLEELVLRSPVDGIVVARRVEPGSVVIAGSPVVEIVDPASLWVRTRIEQREGDGLQVGLEAEIALRGREDRPLAGRVARLEWLADSLTEERWVDVAFETPPEGVPLGSLANVTVRLPPLHDVLWIPAAALQRGPGGVGVWRIEEGRARFGRVETGVITARGRVQVTGGLAPGERVIAYSDRPLREGIRVRERTP